MAVMTLKNIACMGHSVPVLHHLPADEREAYASARDFHERHNKEGCKVEYNVLTVEEYRQILDNPRLLEAYRENADVKMARQSVQTMTVTNLHSLASSATAGWQSAVVDNSANLYLDVQVMTVFDFANTAPANSKGVYIFAYGGLESGVYANPASGSEGTLTLLDVTTTMQALAFLYLHPYTTQDEVSESLPKAIAEKFGGVIPAYWGLAAMNHSGAALAASGNTVKHAGIFATVT